MSGKITRRSFLGTGAIAAVGGAGVNSNTDVLEQPISAALSRTFDVDGDGTDHVQFVSTADPAGKRDSVLQATSQGNATKDYAVSLQNLTPAKLTLEDLVTDGLAYDYYVGADNTSMTPNEVCLVLSGRGKGMELVFRTKDDDRTGGWYTRDVTPELTGESDLPGSDQPWKRLHITRKNATAMDASNIEFLEENLLESFDAETRVRAAGLGHGTPTMEPSTIDTYYDGFTVASTEYELPTTE
ncbi:twin-arginine translocation signal domain-containing protein [Natronococcus wangiae]|uniref:twin-arginine translocation signal domain-containing protein n=1 Tax=Natronococcus wangiae TaxID=3068275 RepID=UPI00273F2FBB|nr:twin-arginine translocation signal domain-containing protein [Natronococcus sp. AD5]